MYYKYLFVAFLAFLCSCSTLKTKEQAQAKENWCMSDCKMTSDEKTNCDSLHMACKEDMADGNMELDSILSFPLRIGIVESGRSSVEVSEASVSKTIEYLNKAFEPAGVRFYIAKVNTLQSEFTIRELSQDFYSPYREFSRIHDLKDTISLFLFDYDEELCKVEGNSISCGRTGGFSYILSELTNNVVLSKFDLEDHKIIVHEFGHFFGLYHTFEEAYGKELISGENCENTGDRICDTPADPGPVFEVYVNYSRCDMLGHLDSEQGAEYHPLINNYMSYYKPCYLTPYAFTSMQLALIHTAAHMDLRRSLAD